LEHAVTEQSRDHASDSEVEAAVYAVLRDCYDPEIPINIVDLGLVYEVSVSAGSVRVTMTLTSRYCPLAEHIAGGVAERLRSVAGVDSIDVDLVFDPPWTPGRMTPAGRAELGLS
jgi:metal-sulfur cluster biosynthetic enzyme